MNDYPRIELIKKVAVAIGIANDDIAMGMLKRGEDEAAFLAKAAITAMGESNETGLTLIPDKTRFSRQRVGE